MPRSERRPRLAGGFDCGRLWNAWNLRLRSVLNDGVALRLSRTGRGMGCDGLVRPPRKVSGHVRRLAVPSARQPELFDPASHPRPCRWNRLWRAAAAPTISARLKSSRPTREVVKLFGQRRLQYRNIFLAGSDVLRLPSETVTAYLETITRGALCAQAGESGEASESSPRLEAVHAFLDNLALPGLPWRNGGSIVRIRLRRVILGVESGDPTIRGLYRKTWANDDLVALVSDLKQADLAVGVMVLVDAGGPNMPQATSPPRPS